MNWTIHVIGATGFFIVVFYVMIHANIAFAGLWKIKPGYIPLWSYLYKLLSLVIILLLVILYAADEILRLHFLPSYFSNVLEWVNFYL